ncbi:verprolin-like [Zea mays]|uniref:verprolin-like n=1 Tax=Zea mays TaxID=4577 RepID=UPI0009AA9736|nr:verprolin-like [Zea mays]|eukprot:XP_020404893.1 verprolin-like [Zea mays]
MVEIPFPLLFPCAQRLHHGHRYLCSNHGALISPAAMAPPSAHSLPAPFLPSASNGTTPPAPTLSRGSNSHGRPEFFFQCPFHLPPSSSISLPFLLFPGAAARSPCSDCSHGVQVPAPSPPIQKQQSLRSSISPMVVSPPSGRHRPLCSALHVRRQPICAASNTLAVSSSRLARRSSTKSPV